MKKRIIVLVFLCLIISGCGKKEVYNVETSLESIITKNNYIIVDVRTKEEYDSGHVKGAINISYDTINEDTNLDKNKTILVYCKSGSRSSKAYNTLKKLKYDVYDLGAYGTIKLDKE